MTETTYTLYSGSTAKSDNLVGSEMSQKYLLGTLEHIFNDMGDGEVRTMTILATQTEVEYEDKEKEIDICEPDYYDGLFDEEDKEGDSAGDPEEVMEY